MYRRAKPAESNIRETPWDGGFRCGARRVDALDGLNHVYSMEGDGLDSLHDIQRIRSLNARAELMSRNLQLLFSQLIRLETELWNAVDARLRSDCDLPLGRFEPMQVISNRKACRVYDIADELAITVGGTSKLVDRIEAAGHCRRRSNPDDRRSSIIELTPVGKRLLLRATTIFEDELELRLGSTLPDRSLDQLTKDLAMLRSSGRFEDSAVKGA
jgi:DNA-binding MarR family transcriptional regulator